MQASNVSTLPTLAELDADRLTEMARTAGEPAWLVERRATAWQQFSESAAPEWRRTDLSKLNAAAVAAPAGVAATQTHVPADLPAGVVVSTLAEAVQTHSALVEQYFGTVIDGTAHKFSALHAALWQDGVFVYVPKNVAVEQPVQVTFTLPAGGNALIPHNLVIVERGASLTYVEEYVGEASAQALVAPATELILNDNAQARYITVQTWGAQVYHIGSQIARVGRDASLEWTAINAGATVQHIESETYLGGNGSRVNWTAATLASDKQSLLTAPWLRHVGENTDGHMDFKTIVNEGGYSTFDGMIKIEKDSKSTVSRLEEHALHLTEGARSDSIPGLKIDTNDVQRAGHASTSGQVDAEQLFYMLSRGIKREDAINMIVMGFFEPVLDRIPSEEMRERLETLFQSKIA